jgi:hypothetical protein
MRQCPFNILIIGLVIVLFNSCTCNRTKANKDSEKLIIHIGRFENDLFSMNLDSAKSQVLKLKSKYGEFFDIYNYKVIQLGSSDDPKYPDNLKTFVTDYYMNLDYKKVKEVFPNVKDIEDELGKAFYRYKTYFPNKKVPRVYTCISGWNQSVFNSDTILAIALDKYLGRNCEFYKKLQLDKYMTYTMERQYIVPDCMRLWGYTEYDMKDSASNILTNMLYEAKILYFVKKMLPETNDTLIFGFTPDQLKWCNNNQKQMWTYLVEHKILFSNDILLAHKLVFPAPYTTLFTKESPGRSCVYLGLKIINSYLKSNPDVSFSQIMKETDYNKILRKSNFKP